MLLRLAGVACVSNFYVGHSIVRFSLVDGLWIVWLLRGFYFLITADRVGLSIFCLHASTCVSPFVDEHKKSDTKSTVQVLYRKKMRPNPRS